MEKIAYLRGPDDRAKGRINPLDYWYQQEITPLDPGDPTYMPPDLADDRTMATGWWIVPMILSGLMVWLAIARWMLGF